MMMDKAWLQGVRGRQGPDCNLPWSNGKVPRISAGEQPSILLQAQVQHVDYNCTPFRGGVSTTHWDLQMNQRLRWRVVFHPLGAFGAECMRISGAVSAQGTRCTSTLYLCTTACTIDHLPNTPAEHPSLECACANMEDDLPILAEELTKQLLFTPLPSPRPFTAGLNSSSENTATIAWALLQWQVDPPLCWT